MVPFRDHATSFTPEQLDVLTTAFYAAMAELTTAGVAISQRDLANRILDRAADGVFDVAELKRAALNGVALGLSFRKPAQQFGKAFGQRVGCRRLSSFSQHLPDRENDSRILVRHDILASYVERCRVHEVPP